MTVADCGVAIYKKDIVLSVLEGSRRKKSEACMRRHGMVAKDTD